MIIRVLDSHTNQVTIQNLVMAFYHGERFPEQEEGKRVLTAKTDILPNGAHSYVTFENGETTVCGEAECLFQDGVETVDRAQKISIGKAIYHVLSEESKKTLPWGIMTGIRPSVIARDLFARYPEETVDALLQKEYYVSPSKLELLKKVTANEGSVLHLSNEKSCSVYISIPFCPSRCNYCSFISYASKKLFALIPSYLEKLKEDIRKTFQTIQKEKLEVLSVYIGGGTPTILTAEQLEGLLSTVVSSYDMSKVLEFTLEGGRPDTITDEKLFVAKKYGVNRMSVNPQTLNDDVLKSIGRNHTVADFYEAFEKVKKSGIEIVNTDLIAGLENDTYESFEKSLSQIIALGPQNITVHSFSVKRPAQILRDNEEIFKWKNEDAQRCVATAYQMLTANGYEPYYLYRQKNTVSDLENVGYAKKGTFGLYNVFMMGDVHTVFGVGAGSTTKIVKKENENIVINRIFEKKYPYEYLESEK